MAWFSDSLRSVIAACNPFGRAGMDQGLLPNAFTHQIALAAYMSSGMLRKVIAIPAADRTQKWRDWQTDKDQIALIEKEEKRLGLQRKVKAAEILRGIGGGALILVTAGDHAQPLRPEAIAKGGLVAINLVSRWQIRGVDWIRDLASPRCGEPEMFMIHSDGQERKIHPSRVVCFRGDPIPAGTAASDEDAFWGDSRLLRVFREVQVADNALQWFASLVKKAKLLRFGIPDLDQMDQDRLAKRVAVIAEGESTLNATLYRAAGRSDDPGETITDYQVTWTGIPEMMDAFNQQVAAVADIPFTRLMGRSPAGMNATGEHDQDNWNDAVSDGQENETRPCLEQIDPVLLRSAGVGNPDEVTWRWAPLWTPTEQEEAETFKTTMEAVTALQNTGTIPDRAFAEGVQNLMEEREYIPGLGAALAKLSEDERFGLSLGEDDGTDPSELTNGGKEAIQTSAGGGANPPRQRPARRAIRAANDTFFADGMPKPLYVRRDLLNAADLVAWAKENGFTSTLPAGDMHVTVLYSRASVDLMKMGRDWREDEKGRLIVRPGGPREIVKFDGGAVVLRFACPDLDWRHKDMVEAGGSHDFDEYQPHVTLTYQAPEGVDLDALAPFRGQLVFGPEIFEALDLDWKSKITEA